VVLETSVSNTSQQIYLVKHAGIRKTNKEASGAFAYFICLYVVRVMDDGKCQFPKHTAPKKGN